MTERKEEERAIPDRTGKMSAVTDRITEETIEYVGTLAKLALSEEEKEQARQDMNRMLQCIDKLNELDTEGMEPMSHVFPVQNVFREDEMVNGDGQENTLLNAPERKGDMFVVPKTFH